MANVPPALPPLAPLLRESVVIPALKGVESVGAAIECQSPILFFFAGTLFELRDVVQRTRPHQRSVFAHVDRIEGVGRDAAGLEFLAREIGVRGVVTTRSALIKAAKEVGLWSVLRLFIMDSEALKTGLAVARSARPDAVEILPAPILPYLGDRLPERRPSLIAGGLVETRQEVEWILQEGGALAVSTSRPALWTGWRRTPGRNGSGT